MIQYLVLGSSPSTVNINSTLYFALLYIFMGGKNLKKPPQN